MANQLLLFPLIYESLVLLIAIGLNILIFQRYQTKKTHLTRLLSLQFLFYLFAIFFSWGGKLLQYIYTDFPSKLNGTSEYFFSLIWDIRAALSMITIGILFSHQFKVEIFEEKFKNNLKNKSLTAVGIIIFIITLVLYNREISYYMLIVYGLVFVYDLIIYVSILTNGIYLSKRMDDAVFKKAFLSIAFMAWCFIAIFLCFLLDQIVAIISDWSYNIFYYLAWLWAVLAIVSSYLGYLKPSEVK